MFKTKRAKAENVAAAVPGVPRPQPQTVIHQAPSEVGKIFAWAVVIVVSVPLAWYFVVYLVEEMGYRQPERTAAFTLAGLGGLLLVSRLLTPFFSAGRDLIIQIAEIRESAKVEIARLSVQAAAQPRPGESRLTEEDSLFCALLRVVMDEAYRHIYRDKDKVQQYTKSDTKPWSREPNNGRTIPGVGEVSFKMAGKVREWLTQEGVIRKDEVNLERFPTFAHFEQLLEEKYYTPVQVNNTLKALSPTLSRQGFSFIDNS